MIEVLNLESGSLKLGIKAGTLRKYALQGIISFRRIGNKICFTENDLQEFLENSKNKRIERDDLKGSSSNPKAKNYRYKKTG